MRYLDTCLYCRCLFFMEKFKGEEESGLIDQLVIGNI